ncbi:unnamed protein product [Fraxinus pennsylvanica]|uniref:TF-B3 domain-containing protein n=1 Tax=Fraxinus pennsylvanica TaxID=56036 RepID=A0AAD1YTU3_9LAMI|nr:unnamed protein product [Fraxinus pennsylvanica]
MVRDGKGRQKPKKASPTVTRFFKIMVHDDYLKVLYLTPDFVQKEPNVIGKPSYLEDSTKQLWPVTVSIVDGYPAIQNGWHKFAVDHNLEVGALLIFSYTRGCHFAVRIYGRTGCERLKFKPGSSASVAPGSEIQHDQNLSKGQGKKGQTGEKVRLGKRSREEEKKTITPDGPLRTLKKNPRGKPGSRILVASGSEFQHDQRVPKPPAASNYGSHFEKRHFSPTNIIMDYSVIMLNSHTGYNQGEDRAYLKDLSTIETGRNESDPNKSKMSSLGGETVPDKIESTVNEIQMAENEKDCIIDHYNDVFGSFPTESAENRKIRKDTSNDERKNAVQDNEALSLGGGQIAGSEGAVVPKYYDCSVSYSLVKDPSGGQTVDVKEKLVEMGEVAFGLPQTVSGKDQNMATECAPMPLQAVKDINIIVKTEPAIQSYQDLPISYPPIGGKDEGGDKQLIFLRDSVGRLWPVMRYSDTLGVTKFLGGWKQFCKENNIQPGNICDLKCENSVQHIYTVI